MDTPCIPGPGTPHPKWGYTRTTINGKRIYAHRAAWESIHGPLPIGLQLDHLCRNRACINVDHLEPVTGDENRRRGIHTNQYAGREVCPQGHLYDEANTYYRRTGGRGCRECVRIRSREYQRRRRAIQE